MSKFDPNLVDRPPDWGPDLWSVDSDDEEDTQIVGGPIGISDDFLLTCHELDCKVSNPDTDKVRGMEVGDDVVNVSSDPRLLAHIIAGQETYMQMSTSWEDTCISDRLFNFCEVTSEIPGCPEQSFHHARKSGTQKDFCFTDVLPQRVIMPVSKQIGDFSSTTVGKMAWVRSRLGVTKPSLRGMLTIANLFQDAFLRVDKASEPKYLPRIMGGTGVLDQDPKNLFIFTNLYKDGEYARIFASAVQELRQTLDYAESNRPYCPVLCKQLRRKQEYLHITWDNLVFVPERPGIGRPGQGEILPLYKAVSPKALHISTEQRLVSSRLILGKQAAEVELMRSVRISDLLFSRYFDFEKESQRLINIHKRETFENRLSAKAAVKRLLDRRANHHDRDKMLLDDAFRVVDSGRLKFTKSDANWLALGGKSETYSILDISFQEDMYLREELSIEETLKVSGIPIRDRLTGKVRDTTTKVGLYQISRPMKEWADNIVCKLRDRKDSLNRSLAPVESIPILISDLEWVQDDSGIIAEAFRILAANASVHSSPIALITTDSKLGWRVCRSVKQIVYMIHPEYLIHIGKVPFSSTTNVTLEDLRELDWETVTSRGHRKPVGVIPDTGSILASLSKKRRDKKNVELLSYDWNSRSATYRVTPITGRGKHLRILCP